MGVIELDPKDFLVKGIKNEIVRVVSKILHTYLIFKTQTVEAFNYSISMLSNKLDNLRIAMEYVQDIVGINALNIWVEQLKRVIDFNVQKETNSKELLKSFLTTEEKDNGLREVPFYDPVDGY